MFLCNYQYLLESFLENTCLLWHLDILCGSAGKESTRNAGDLVSIPELGRSPGEGKGYLLQYSGLENFMDFIVSPWGLKESDMTEWISLPLWHVYL